MKKKCVRLGCDFCFRADMEGITYAKLRKLKSKKGGWTRVRRFQTYAQSIKTYDDPKDAPPGYSLFDWQTHFGCCPDCQENAT